MISESFKNNIAWSNLFGLSSMFLPCVLFCPFFLQTYQEACFNVVKCPEAHLKTKMMTKKKRRRMTEKRNLRKNLLPVRQRR